LKNLTVAKRYAKSLVELAQENDKLEKLFADMTALQEIVVCVPHFVKALSDERISTDKRLDVAKRISKELKLWKCTGDVLLLLIEKRRMDILPEISKSVISIIRLMRKMAVACAQVANSTTAEHIKAHVEDVLTKHLGLLVQCEVGVDPSLIGGFIVEVGDLRFDSSVKGKLTRMKEEFFSEAKGY